VSTLPTLAAASAESRTQSNDGPSTCSSEWLPSPAQRPAVTICIGLGSATNWRAAYFQPPRCHIGLAGEASVPATDDVPAIWQIFPIWDFGKLSQSGVLKVTGNRLPLRKKLVTLICEASPCQLVCSKRFSSLR